MPLADRGEAVGVVLLGVRLAADAEEAQLEQAHRTRQYALARHAVEADVVGDLLAELGKTAGEAQDPVVLLAVPRRSPLVVVAVLAATLGVHPGGLDVPVRVRADPHVLPGRRDGQRLDASDHLVVGDALAVGLRVGEALAGPPPADPRPVAVDLLHRHGPAPTPPSPAPSPQQPPEAPVR